jgi:hypothetical protein
MRRKTNKENLHHGLIKSRYRHVGIAKFPVAENPVCQDLAIGPIVITCADAQKEPPAT